MSHPDFGWLLPTGRRVPEQSEEYLAHVRRVLDRIRGRFHAAWVPDHFMDGKAFVPEAMVTISYLAGLYPDLFFGTAVLGQSYRHPALLAKMAAQLQHLSRGRFIMGIGAGWKEEEYRAYGYAFPKASVRIAQMAEAVQICRLMWDVTREEATFRGRYYQIERAVCRPKPNPPPPVMIGGGGEKLTLRAVAQYADWWNLPGAPPEEYARKLELLQRYCAERDRPDGEIRKTWMGVVSVAPTRLQARKQMEGYPIWPGDVPLLGAPDDIKSQLQRYVDLGVDAFILSFSDEPQLNGLDLFLGEVLGAPSTDSH